MKKIEKFVLVPIFNNEYKIIVCWDSLLNARKLMKQYGYVDLITEQRMEGMRGLSFYGKDCYPFIMLPKFPRTAEEIGTLAHEATHAVDYIFDAINHKKNMADEIFGNAVGAVVRTVLQLIK